MKHLQQSDRSGYLSEKTIAAIATATGGAISIVRVSGSEAFQALEKTIRSSGTIANGKSESRPGHLVRRQLFSEKGEPLDDAMVVRFVQPHSYTGENLVEFHIHGGNFIAQRLMETLQAYGVRQALPGEFSFRAVKNGKMSLFQAQAVSDLISATNDGAISLALEKISGLQNQKLQDLASHLKRTATLGELGIDFADQDIDEVSLPTLKRNLKSAFEMLESLKNSYSKGIRLQEGIRVAFIGLPNAGKSSFFNALLGEDRSIVSEHAGTTRDVVREKLTLRGTNSTVTLRLEDTAGLRKTDNPIEKEGIERSIRASREAELVLFLVDATCDNDFIQQSVLDQWKLITQGQSIENKTIGILTKSDLVNSESNTQLSQLLAPLGIPIWVTTSSHSGFGISLAIEAIVEFCEKLTSRSAGECLITRLDHQTAVIDALEHLNRALLAPEIELFASDIRQALHSLAPLIGETVPDDILNQIFSDFCIGK